MADDLLSYENMNDDEDGGPSEDEYDALNDETFGGDGDGLDWEVEHEQLAHITESSRQHKDHLDLEASLSRLVLDEDDGKQPVSGVWPPPPLPQSFQPTMIAQSVGGLKKVCTVEELERQMRQQAQQPAQQPTQHNQQQNYFQPRFPVILQRPPGLSGPVPLPFNPGLQMNHNQNINPMMHNNQLGPPNQIGPNQIGPNQMGSPNQMGPAGLKVGMNNMQMDPNNRLGPNNQIGLNHMQNPGPNPQMMNGNFGMGQMNMMIPPHMMQQTRMLAPQPPINNMQRFPNQGQFTHNFRGLMDQQNKQGVTMNHQNINQQQFHQNPNQVHQQQMFNQQSQQLNHQPPMSQQQMSQGQQNSPQLIQSTHPMLVHGSLHNANNHPMLARNKMNQQRTFNQRTFTNNTRYTNGLDSEQDEPEDEYAGLMSQREKQWLLNIQMLQLNTGTPYIEDYYYTVWQERKARKEREGVKEAHKANQQNHPFYSGGNKQDNRERHRHNSTSEDQPTPRTYVPTQFENSLGKLQCGSVTAPRKIIDVEVVRESDTGGGGRPSRAPSVASTTHPHEGPREVRRAKQTLLDIEALYLVLLRLEELNDPLAIANALVLKEREEKAKLAEAVRGEEEDGNVFLRNIESVQRRATELHDKVADKRQVVSLNPPAPEAPKQKNLLDENKAELISRLFAGLIVDDRLQNVLSVRKGKLLVERFLWRVPAPHARLRALWSKALRALPHAARRDTHDNLLPRLATHFQQYIGTSSGWAAIIETCAHISEILDPARTPHALITPLTLTCVKILIERASTLITTSEATANERQWTKFLKSVARTLKNATVSVAKPIEPLNKNDLQNHIRLIESKTTVEILQRGKTQPEFADLAKNELSEILVKYLC